jgi:hypothetical protein
MDSRQDSFSFARTPADYYDKQRGSARGMNDDESALRDSMSTCRFILKAMFTSRPLPTHPLDRYGILIVILGLLAVNLWWYFRLSPAYSGDPYTLFVGGLTGLFCHLAFSFQWRPSVTVALRVLTWSWLVFAFFYAFYLTRVLYP